tara:strand:- start:24 stop:284 length:261 start_codon:yes stop_codon:yes gene_type:complete
MAKYSMKRGGKEVGPASVYAKPHTMTGKAVNARDFVGRNVKPMPSDYISVGNYSTVDFDQAPKKPTIKIRGCGAATKGTMASDKMG